MTVSVPPPRPADLIAEYVWLRDGKKAQEAAFETWLKENYGDRMEQIESQLLAHLKAAGTDSAKANNIGTAYKKRIVSVTVSDMNEFRRHVIGTEQWDLADWKANKTVVTELVDNDGVVPPGVNYSAMDGVGIRKS